MATHSSILAWEIPRTEKPGGPQSVESESDMTKHTDTRFINTVFKYKIQAMKMSYYMLL